jgi:hypothetical protein
MSLSEERVNLDFRESFSLIGLLKLANTISPEAYCAEGTVQSDPYKWI